MTIDFDHLASLDEGEFEWERAKLIQEYIMSLPADKRKKAYALQLELDLKRDELGHNKFLGYCFERMAENMENTADLLNTIRHAVLQPSAEQTRKEAHS